MQTGLCPQLSPTLTSISIVCPTVHLRLPELVNETHLRQDLSNQINQLKYKKKMCRVE